MNRVFIQNILTLTLTAGILASTLMVPLAYLDFELRKDYIAEVLCINRELPKKGCEGQCFLKKRLSQVNDNQGKQSTTPQEQFQLSFFNQIYRRVIEEQLSVQVESEFSGFLLQVQPPSHIGDIFHPPRKS